MKSKLVHIILLIFICLTTYGQKPKFYTSTDARKIVEGSYLQVKFILEQADGSNFKAPPFNGFTVASGPSTSNSTSIMNGVVKKQNSIIYTLVPKGKGTKTISPASVRVNGRVLKTQPITIEVVKGSNKAVESDKQLFIKTELTDSSTYVGQQIILNYKLYTTVDVRSINFTTEQEFDGFFAEQLKISRQNYSREIIDGVEYFTKPLKKIALFPQQTGTYTIAPVGIRLGLATKGSSRSFFTSQLIQKNLIAEGKTIYVNSLPPATPAFSGAVGRYKMTAKTNKRSLTTDEAINVVMTITGNGDSKTVNPPKWELPEGLEMYDPNVIEDEIFRSATGLTHRKTFEYLIVAKEPGKYVLKPNFEYFDVDSSSFQTIKRTLSRITVLKGTNTPVVIEEKESLQLAGISENTKLFKIPSDSTASPLPSILLLLSFLGSLGIYFYSNHLKQSGKFDPELIKRNKAYEVALKRLDGSKAYMDQEKPKEFYEEMIIALKTYLTDKFSIPALHINRSELINRLKEEDLSESALSTFNSLLEKSEVAMYAPSSNSNLKETYETALELIAELEK